MFAVNYYAEHAQQLKHDLAREISADEQRVLHRRRPLLHAAIAAANFGALVAAGIAITMLDRWYLWLPFAVVAGFAIFNCTLLLHEVVHHTILSRLDRRAYRILGLL